MQTVRACSGHVLPSVILMLAQTQCVPVCGSVNVGEFFSPLDAALMLFFMAISASPDTRLPGAEEHSCICVQSFAPAQNKTLNFLKQQQQQ